MNSGPQHLVILVRHASRERHWRLPESTHWMKDWNKGSKVSFPEESDSDAKGDAEGLGRTYALAGRLCDELKILAGEQDKKIIITDIVHSRHTVARQTARAYLTVLKERSERELAPESFSLAGTLEDLEGTLDPESFSLEDVIEKIEDFKEKETDRASTAAFIVVGHQPQLTQIARELLKRRPLGLLSPSALPGNSLPLGNSEAACIRLGYGWLQWHRPRLLWLLTEKTGGLLTDLKDKIKSKYDVAKFFLGAFVVNIGLFLNAGIWNNINFGDRSQLVVNLLAAFGIITALASLAFTAATLFSYDSLLMPESLWSEPGGESWRSKLFSSILHRRRRRSSRKPPKWSVLRPPSQAHVILFYEMMHVWTCFFIPAVILAFVTIVSLVCSLALGGVKVPLLDSLLESFTFWWPLPPFWWPLPRAALLSIGLTFLISWGIYRRWRPRLGTED